MKRRFLAVILVMALAFTSMSGGLNALAASALTEQNMTDSILELKGRIGVGDEYTVFNYDFYENGSGATWYFYWNTEDGSKYIYASCDGQKHIQYFEKYGNEQTKSVPKYTSDELVDTAKAAIARIEPGLEKHIVFRQAHCNSYNSSYVFTFYRIENGIEMPDNQISISINYNTKEVCSYNENWLYDADIPNADGLIGKDAAAQKAGKNVEMQLRYYITYDENGTPRAFLAYAPDKSYIAVDAHSGKIYEEKTYWGGATDSGMSNEMMKDDAEADNEEAPRLSEAEIAKVEELKDIISSEKAVEIIKTNKSLHIDPNMNVVDNAKLYNDGEGNYYWNLYMRDNRPYDWENNDTYRAYASANVNAHTGEILSFYASVKSMYDFSDEEVATVKANYTKSKCKKIAENFLKEVNADRFANVKLLSTYENHPIAYDYDKSLYTYAGFAFSYERVNEDIPVNGNSINVSVDAVSGKIFSYNYSWIDDIELPTSKDAIDAKAAFDKYISYDGFDLVYEITTSYTSGSSYYGDDVKQSVRLVYRTAISPALTDAFTGKQLNWSGEEYVPVNNDYSYTDIEGTKYERTIKILASMGVGFEGSEFKPDQVITRDEFQKLANGLRGYTGYNSFSISGTKGLTRQMAAKAVIGYLGMDKIAALDIYKTGYSDEKKISKGYVGYVALAKGLGIMKAASGKKFKPTAKVTRGEAAQILLNMTAVE